ncbi:MAG: protein jag [Firmicutes bacterium]|jgi:spoIIIJ-associated protein|nr:protein jag [Bacillota bacterium]
MRTIERSARTVEEAIAEALEELQVTREDVEIEVLDEGSRAFLGLIGGKLARVRVTVKDKREEKAQATAEFLKGILDRMGIVTKVDYTWEDEDVLKLDIQGEELGLVIGRRGETLDALQYLVSLAMNRNGEWVRIILDAEGYRARREETLRNLALRLGERVKRTGRRAVLDPMNAMERRIIHLALQDDSGVETHSEGVAPYRRVIIAPRRHRGERT